MGAIQITENTIRVAHKCLAAPMASLEDAPVYEMPQERLASVRRSLRILILAVGAGQALAIAFVVGVILRGYVFGGLYALAISMGIFGLLLIISGPLTLHNRLVIHQSGLIPLRRPFLSKKDSFLSIDQIARIELHTLPGDERSFYEFEIWDSGGGRFRVNSLVLARYDRRATALDHVFDAMCALKKRVESQQPSGTPDAKAS